MNAGSDWYPPIAKRAIRVGQSPPAKGHRKSCTDCEKLVASAKHGTTPTSSPTSSDEASCMVHCGLQKQSGISRPTIPSVNRASNIAESGKPTPLAFPGFKTCIQAKLRINPPDDAYEREADRMSEHVTSGPGHSIAAKPVPISRIGMVQRACACGGTCANCKDNSEDEHLQRKSPPAAANDGVPAIVDEALRAPGQPLDGVTRVSMERRFGYDFSKVRVHTDSLAERSARAIQARAFTVGHHLVFDAGGYNTHTHTKWPPAAGPRIDSHRTTRCGFASPPKGSESRCQRGTLPAWADAYGKRHAMFPRHPAGQGLPGWTNKIRWQLRSSSAAAVSVRKQTNAGPEIHAAGAFHTWRASSRPDTHAARCVFGGSRFSWYVDRLGHRSWWL